VTTAFRYTSADLEKLPYVEGVRYEIIDGELHVSRQPHAVHQYVSTVLTGALLAWIRAEGSGAVIPAPGLILSPGDNVAPDLIWVKGDRWVDALDEKGHFTTAPELAIEVLSPGRVNEVRDRELKLDLYSRHGVREYWIVDWQGHTVEVYRRDAEALAPAATLHDGDALGSPLLAGFACSVSSLWP
jgi:Uma2 family endonuclease